MSRNWEKINRQIDTFIKKNQNEIIENVCRLVRIPSVRKGCNIIPYGVKCAEALDFCAELAKEKGLIVDNYDYYGLEIRLQKEQSKSGCFLRHMWMSFRHRKEISTHLFRELWIKAILLDAV